MRRGTLSTLLLAGGVGVGVVAATALALGFDPAPLSNTLVKIALYKLTFIAATGLLVAGAMVGRWARRDRIARSGGAVGTLHGRALAHDELLAASRHDEFQNRDSRGTVNVQAVDNERRAGLDAMPGFKDDAQR